MPWDFCPYAPTVSRLEVKSLTPLVGVLDAYPKEQPKKTNKSPQIITRGNVPGEKAVGSVGGGGVDCSVP